MKDLLCWALHVFGCSEHARSSSAFSHKRQLRQQPFLCISLVKCRGNGDGVLNDLQAYDSSKNSWAEITAGQGYGGRTATFQHAAAFKSSTREMFIMGGSDNSKQPAEHYSDMWGYNPAWSQWIDEFVRFSDPRYAASLVYNSNNETLILFGGVDWNKNQARSGPLA